jgi:hypothetical protein
MGQSSACLKRLTPTAAESSREGAKYAKKSAMRFSA